MNNFIDDLVYGVKSFIYKIKYRKIVKNQSFKTTESAVTYLSKNGFTKVGYLTFKKDERNYIVMIQVVSKRTGHYILKML